MKKIITFVILAVSIVGIESCKKNETPTPTNQSTTPSQTTPVVLETFTTTTGTSQFTVPSNVTSITIEVWGGGGGGGSSFQAQTGNCGGGGSGGYGQINLSVTPGSVYNVIVGAGGACGNATVSNQLVSGVSGGTSSFSSSTQTLISASGGSGGCYCGGSVGSQYTNGVFPGGGGGGGGYGSNGGNGAGGQVVITTN